MSELVPSTGPSRQLLYITQLVYFLHGLSILIGVMAGGTVITAFLFGWPSIVAVILNYVMRSDARGTYLESHFSWQIRTFWYGMIWTFLVAIVGLLLAPFVIGPFIWIGGFVVLGIWVGYRIAFGWVRLRQDRAVF